MNFFEYRDYLIEKAISWTMIHPPSTRGINRRDAKTQRKDFMLAKVFPTLMLAKVLKLAKVFLKFS